MRFLNYLKNILTGLSESLKRFPFTILISASVAAVLIVKNETHPATDDLSRLAMALALGIPISLCIKLFFERKEEKSTFKLIAAYALGGLFILFYYGVFIKDMHMVTGTRYIGISLALYMAFLFIPYFFKKENFEMYVISLVTGFFTSIIYSIVLFSGLSAILFALQRLLEVNITEDSYYYSFLFVVFIFAVSYFLAEIPKRADDLAAKKYPHLLKILLLYIVMPLLVAYTAILYIYFGRIPITRVWPEGPVAVSHLVLWYGVIVTVVLFLTTPIREEKSWQKNFHRLAPMVIIPLIIMMFIAIGIRINAYGLTERRYYVVILGIWLLCVMVYLIFFRKRLKNILLPVSLAVIALISVFGPLSSYSLSMMSQNSRLEQYLVKNQMLKDGKIQPKSDVPKDDRAQISSILQYFDNQHTLAQAKLVPENFKINDMGDVFGFDFETTYYPAGDGYFSYTRDNKETSLDISGYDVLIDNRFMSTDNPSSASQFYAKYDYNTAVLKLYKGKNEIFSKDLNEIAVKIVKKYKAGTVDGLIPAEDMTFEAENDICKVKIIFFNISGDLYNVKNSDAKGMEFYVLIKAK